MTHFKTIRRALVFFVFFILLISGITTFIFIYTFRLTSMFTDHRMLLLFISSIVGSIAVGTFLTIFVSAKILKPLQSLIEATQKVGKGDFTAKITPINDKISPDNEMNQLINSFNQMTHELSSIEMLKKDFINNFSHEFKTPIASIIGYAKELEYDDLTSEERKKYTSIIISESERLSTLASHILLLSKLENQVIVTDKKYFQLDEQLRKVILILQKEWERKDIELDIQLQPIQYFGNEELLQQVWVNLLDNVIKFSKQGGTIRISCYIYDDMVKVKITDNGIGMSDQTLKHIFDKFYQGDASHSTKGNGLGLALVNRIIHLCHGKITVKSQIDQGTSFTIWLPLEISHDMKE